jgi:hypothetical protein
MEGDRILKSNELTLKSLIYQILFCVQLHVF